MWIKTSGALSENVFQMTTEVSTHILVIGEAAALIDTGIAATWERLSEQLDHFVGPGGTLDFILLTSAEFSNVGSIANLKMRYPDCELVVSPHCAENLANQDYLAEMFQRNQECAEAFGKDLSIDIKQWTKSLVPDRIVGDGDVIDLGDDVEIKLIATPGYRSDAVCYFVQCDSALAVGKCAGSYGGRDKIANTFLYDYVRYMESIRRLSGLDVKVLGFGHAGVLSGELVPKYFASLQSQAQLFCKNVQERIAQGELIDEVYAAVLADYTALDIAPVGPFTKEHQDALRSMIKAVAAVSVEGGADPKPE